MEGSSRHGLKSSTNPSTHSHLGCGLPFAAASKPFVALHVAYSFMAARYVCVHDCSSSSLVSSSFTQQWSCKSLSSSSCSDRSPHSALPPIATKPSPHFGKAWQHSSLTPSKSSQLSGRIDLN